MFHHFKFISQNSVQLKYTFWLLIAHELFVVLSKHVRADVFHVEMLRTEGALNSVGFVFEVKLLVHFQVSRQAEAFIANLTD